MLTAADAGVVSACRHESADGYRRTMHDGSSGAPLIFSRLTTFQRSLTMQFGGRMSACSDVPFMLPMSWRAGTRHCICQPDRTRAAPSLKEPFICEENRRVRPSLSWDTTGGRSGGTRIQSIQLPEQAIHQLIRLQAGRDGQGHRTARCSAATTPHQPTRAGPRTSHQSTLPSVPENPRATLRPNQGQPTLGTASPTSRGWTFKVRVDGS